MINRQCNKKILLYNLETYTRTRNWAMGTFNICTFAHLKI